MASCEEYTPDGHCVPDEVGSRWGGEQGVPPDHHLSNLFGSGHLDGEGGGMNAVIAPIAADDKGRPFEVRADSPQEGLDEVFRVIFLLVDLQGLPETGGAWLLVIEGRSLDGDNSRL